MTTEVKTLVDELNRDFAEFKRANDAGNKDLADRIENGLNEIEEKIVAIQTAGNRSAISDEQAERNEKKAANGALTKFAKKGEKGYFADTLEEKTGYDITTDANGKYGVPKVIDSFVGKQVRELSPIRQLVTVKTIGTTAYNGLLNLNNATAGNVAETGTRTGTSANTFAIKTINVHEQYANPAVTLQMLEDVQFDAESELLFAVSEAFAALEGSNFVNGTGDGNYMAKGFMTYTTQDITDGSLGAHDKLNTIDSIGDLVVNSDDIINLTDALPAQFAANAAFGISRKYLNKVRKLKNGTTGEYLWQPSYQAGVPSSLAGYPVHVLADMPTAATAGTLPIVFADWKNFYYAIDRVGLSILRDPYTVEGSVVFKFRKRQGGGLFNGRAGVALKLIDQA